MPLHLHVLRQLWIQLIDFRTLHESFFDCAVGLLVMSLKRNPARATVYQDALRHAPCRVLH